MIKAYFPLIAKRISYRAGMIFSKVPISPTNWTLLSIIPASLGAYFMARHSLKVSLLLFVLAGALDLIDGAVARFTGKVTRFGAFLDGATDRVVEFLMVLGLFLYGIPALRISGEMWLLILLFAGTCMTSFIPAYAAYKKVVYSEELAIIGGILERPERLIVIYASMIAGLYNPVYMTAGIAFGAILAVVTVVQRIRFVARYREG